MNAREATYEAGVCNIGEAEISRRIRAGWGGAAVTAVVWAGLAIADLAAPWYWLLVVPALVAAVGFVQARSRFCVNYGLRHMFNFADIGSTTRVENAEAIRLDRRRSWQIIGTSVVIAFLIAGAGVLTA